MPEPLAIGDARGLDRIRAAAYVGLCPNTFDAQVASGAFPAPLRFGRRRVWDRRALDQALDELSGIGPRSDEAAWLGAINQRGHRAAQGR